MDLKFYKCMHCGNIAIKPFDAGVPLVCCGEKMTELTANTTDAAVEKHVPVVRVDGLERARRGGQHAASHGLRSTTSRSSAWSRRTATRSSS